MQRKESTFWPALVLAIAAMAASLEARATDMFYRADHRHPEEVFAKGMDAPGKAGPLEGKHIAVSDHVSSLSQFRSIYVSLTADHQIAYGWGSTMFHQHPYYVYVVRPDARYYNAESSIRLERDVAMGVPDMPEERKVEIVNHLDRVASVYKAQEWVTPESIDSKNIKEARSNYRMDGGVLKWDTTINPHYVDTATSPNPAPLRTDVFSYYDRSDLHGLWGTGGSVFPLSFLPGYCTSPETNPACPPVYLMHVPGTLSLQLNFGEDKLTGVHEGDDRWWVDIDNDGQTDLCVATGSKMSCNYNNNLNFATVASTSERDLGWTNGARAWVYVSSGDTRDFCRIVYSYTEIRCSPVANPGQAGVLFKSADVVSGYIDAGYDTDRFWGDVGGPNGGPIDGRADFCRVIGKASSLGQYSLACQIAGAGENGNFSEAYSGDWIQAIPDSMVGSSLNKAMVDVNGDKAADYCVAWGAGTPASLVCKLSDPAGRGFMATYDSTFIYAFVASTVQWLDYNGNGQVDFCARFLVASSARYQCHEAVLEHSTFYATANFQYGAFLADYEMAADVGGRGRGMPCGGSNSPAAFTIRCYTPKQGSRETVESYWQANYGNPGVSNRKQVYLPRGPEGNGTYCRSTNLGFTGQIVCKKLW